MILPNNIKRTNAARWLIMATCCVLFSLMGKAGHTVYGKDTAAVKFDTHSVVHVRAFSSRQLDVYRQSRDFQYETDTGETLGWWDRLKRWFWEKVWQAFNYSTETAWGRALLIMAVIALMVFIAFKMAGVDKGWFLDKRNSSIPSFYAGEDDVHSINFDQAIGEAVQQHNYKVAVRLWYLMTLKNLTDKGLINWKPGKTNYEYALELDGSGYDRDFIRLTNNFESCWYGQSSLGSSDYEIVQHHFSSFNQQLS